jgi:O-acetyl-ADP-ribose deacetylase (regulator of RNase III)
VFHFPNDEAAKIAVDTVLKCLDGNEDKFDRVIFNVFKDYDLELYNEYMRWLLK